jgi:hypothetical protein
MYRRALVDFAAAAAGAAIRLNAIRWIDDAIGADGSHLKDRAAGALAELAQVLLSTHAGELISTPDARRALNNVIGRMVRDQAPYVPTLQDCARALR